MNEVIRCHDIYIASPNSLHGSGEPYGLNCHAQSCMYVGPLPKAVTITAKTKTGVTQSTKTPIVKRALSLEMRVAKLNDLWKQLDVLESMFLVGSGHFVGNMSLADLTVFPSMVYMEYYLVKVFDWSIDGDVFFKRPKLKNWYYSQCCRLQAFLKVKEEILVALAASENVQDAIVAIKADIVSEEGIAYKWKGFGSR